MAKLLVKNIGPIIDGCDSNDGFIDFNKYTLFIGDQGTGKSTIAKLISICSWLEKAFFRGDYDVKSFEALDFKELCRNQLLADSFSEKAEIEYSGDAYHFLYKKNIFFAEEMHYSIDKYSRPKIMYIPSERNILSVVKNVDELNNLPPMLRLLRRRYLQASEQFNGNRIFNLPLSGYKAIVNKSNGETLVSEEKSGKAVSLICASSGLQSIVPSTVVTDFLADTSKHTILEKIRSLNEKSVEMIKQSINQSSVKEELDRYITSGLSKSVSDSSLEIIKSIAKKYTNGYFMNIVEEPEQNLFPDSQIKNLEFLLAAANSNAENRIIITTHSPYIISHVTLAAKAFELSKNNVPEDKIAAFVPKSSWIDGNDCRVYQLENGKIKPLPVYGRGLPSDENMLNIALSETNNKFDSFLDLEEEFGN